MLKMFRKNTKIIIWLVIISFALWGAYSVGTQFQKEGRLAGEVFGKAVHFQEFNQFYRAGQVFSYTGQRMDDPEILRQHAWQSILYSREAKQQNIQVSDEEVRSEVKRLLKKQGIEEFTPAAYRHWLENTVKEPPKEFESQIREILRIEKLISHIKDQPIPPSTPEEAWKKFQIDSQTLQANAIRFDALEEAKKFYLKVKETGQWEIEAKTYPDLKMIDTQKIRLSELISQWQLSEEDALSLHRLAKDEISEPIRTGTTYSVFRLLDKQEVAKENFTKELEEKHLQELADQKRYLKFIEWSVGLRSRARLKDYLLRTQTSDSST